MLTYGFGAADVVGSRLVTTSAGLSFAAETPWGKAELQTRLFGAFNAYNLLGVLAVLLVSGVELAKAVEYLAQVEAPPGRMQRLGGHGAPLVVIDYAHTPDALDKALTALRPSVVVGGDLVCIFGCGGERDRGKRPEMGRVAARLADRVLVTNDNPRSEDPAAIIAQAMAGIRGEAEAIEDRQVAIFSAVHHATPGDVVLLAGKGHETYQEIAGARHPFDDREVARAALAEWQRGSR